MTHNLSTKRLPMRLGAILALAICLSLATSNVVLAAHVASDKDIDDVIEHEARAKSRDAGVMTSIERYQGVAIDPQLRHLFLDPSLRTKPSPDATGTVAMSDVMTGRASLVLASVEATNKIIGITTDRVLSGIERPKTRISIR